MTAVIKSVLEKPLHELTDDDISQLTRDDCRRYLKEKGMRRPSWNKSQAIQQVICLKSLLEPSPPSPVPKPSVRALEKPPLLLTNTVTSSSSSSVKELSPAEVEGSVSASAEDGGPCQPAGSSGLDPAGEGECRPATINVEAIPGRKHCGHTSTDAPDLPIGQMTIFYSGKVNVYDGVPIDKARAIMHIAASPIQFCQDEPSNGNSVPWSTPSQLPASRVKFNVATPDAAIVQSMLTDAECQTNRQVSLQRYFEKRKDRGKFKMKRKVGSSSSGLEIYLNHQMRTPVNNGQITQSNTSSPNQFGIPCTDSVLMDKQPKNPGLSVDLNDKA